MMTTRSGLPIVPYQINGLSDFGDDPATIAQIIDAGYDPTIENPNLTYTVDENGNVIQNLTATASAPGAAQQKPIWPLVMVLGLIGFSLFEAGKRS